MAPMLVKEFVRTINSTFLSLTTSYHKQTASQGRAEKRLQKFGNHSSKQITGLHSPQPFKAFAPIAVIHLNQTPIVTESIIQQHTANLTSRKKSINGQKNLLIKQWHDTRNPPNFPKTNSSKKMKIWSLGLKRQQAHNDKQYNQKYLSRLNLDHKK